MAIFSKRAERMVIASAFAVCAMLPFAVGASSLSDRVDSLAGSLDDIESKVQSTMFSGGSSPVSFSGEARIKAQYHDLGYDAPGYMQADRSYFQSGWEGNENLFRLGMVARVGRNLTLWSKIGFQHTMTGNRSYHDPDSYDPLNELYEPGYTPYQYRHDKGQNSVSIHEDMAAGVAVRTLPASFWVKMGNTMWTEASPLTIWKTQPRTFAWEYLPFEVEQPIARYYEYNIAKGIKEGRAAWNKKPFNGINIESIKLFGNVEDMPFEPYVNFVYGTFERFDNFEREYVDFAGESGYGDGALFPFPEKGHGIGDTYRHVIHGRLAFGKMFGSDMTLGANYVGIQYNDDIIYMNKRGEDLREPGSSPNEPSHNNNYPLITEFRGYDSVFYKEPKTFSLDVKGAVSENFTIHADLALNWTDTTWMIDPDKDRTYAERMHHPEWYTDRATTSSDLRVAAYTKLGYNGFLPMELDLAYIPPGFYSPFSFATPVDAFFAFGSNMLGAGKFIGRGEGAPYTQNMAGVSLTLNPKLKGYGHLRLKYGQHFNVNDEGSDLLVFMYRLNGADMNSFLHSTYNRWGNGLIDNSVKSPGKTYKARLGDESYWAMSGFNNNFNVRPAAGPGAGGIRGEYLSMYEGFVAYNSAEEAYFNFRAKMPFPSPIYGMRPFDANDNVKNMSTIINNSKSVFEYDIDSVSITFLDMTSFEYVTVNYGDPRWTGIVDSLERGLLNSPELIVDITDSTFVGVQKFVPQSQKYTFNLELDAAYDIGRFIGYKKDLFIGGYVGINGVTRSNMSVLAFDEKGDNTLLWSSYIRLEPAIALNKNFYLLGLIGFENWKSDKSWMMVHKNNRGQVANLPSITYPGNTDGDYPRQTGATVFNPTVTENRSDLSVTITPDNFVKVPIDYRDVAFGIGFDWDMLERVGLHGRVKWISHTDKGLNDKYKEWHKEGWNIRDADGNITGTRDESIFNYTSLDQNDWSSWVVSLEMKMWF